MPAAATAANTIPAMVWIPLTAEGVWATKTRREGAAWLSRLVCYSSEASAKAASPRGRAVRRAVESCGHRGLVLDGRRVDL